MRVWYQSLFGNHGQGPIQMTSTFKNFLAAILPATPASLESA